MKICNSLSFRAAWLLCCLALCLPEAAGQVNSGSDGHDGAFNPTQNVVIDMADHPDGIYQYTSVNIPTGVTVTFRPNARNTPVVWLVQGDCSITGIVWLTGSNSNGIIGANGGVGGFRGGNASQSDVLPSDGVGPGGGRGFAGDFAGNASFATLGDQNTSQGQASPGATYGNPFLLPLCGGSGGGGTRASTGGGGGGGGAIMVAASNITISGGIYTTGGNGFTNLDVYGPGGGGGGSGGAIRLVATTIDGAGQLNAAGGAGVGSYHSGWGTNPAGSGRIRLDALQIIFAGSMTGVATRGFQPIIIPPASQAMGLSIQSVAGIPVNSYSNGSLTNPDVTIPGQQTNPVPVTVNCLNVPLNTEIIVDAKPANGPTITAVGVNSVGTLSSSTASVSLNMPKGGGTIQAKCVSGISGTLSQTGLTAAGERFASVEVTATLGGKQQLAFITESGKRYASP